MIVITKVEYDTNDFTKLYDNSWSGATQTLDDIKDVDKEEEFMNFLEQVFTDEVDATTLNDFIWFEREYIYENLGLDENGELINNED